MFRPFETLGPFRTLGELGDKFDIGADMFAELKGTVEPGPSEGMPLCLGAPIIQSAAITISRYKPNGHSDLDVTSTHGDKDGAVPPAIVAAVADAKPLMS